MKGSHKTSISSVRLLGFMGFVFLFIAGLTIYLSFVNLKEQMLESLSDQADMIADNVGPALRFQDQSNASQILSSVSSNDQIQRVLLLGSDYKPFAGWVRYDDGIYPILVSSQVFNLQKSDLYQLHREIRVADQVYGMLILDYEYDSLLRRIMVFASSTALAILVALLFAWGLLRWGKQIEQSKNKIEKDHQHVQESIQYALLIQRALIPDASLFKQYFDDHFCLWKPKDVVGGDIYSLIPLRHQDEVLLMVVDCTGHGVPGAFVTMLVKAIEHQMLSSLMQEYHQISPASILSDFNRKIKEVLQQKEKGSGNQNVGFDGLVAYINYRRGICRFASANMTLISVQNEKATLHRGDRHSIGYKRSNEDYHFTEETLYLNNSTKIYITTDGLIDQLGDERGFGFGKKKLLSWLTSHHHLPMEEQQKRLLQTLKLHQKDLMQTDDITVLGLSCQEHNINRAGNKEYGELSDSSDRNDA